MKTDPMLVFNQHYEQCQTQLRSLSVPVSVPLSPFASFSVHSGVLKIVDTFC